MGSYRSSTLMTKNKNSSKVIDKFIHPSISCHIITIRWESALRRSNERSTLLVMEDTTAVARSVDAIEGLGDGEEGEEGKDEGRPVNEGARPLFGKDSPERP